jgi:hypothetical protein
MMPYNQVPEVNYERLLVGPSPLSINSFAANESQVMSSSF